MSQPNKQSITPTIHIQEQHQSQRQQQSQQQQHQSNQSPQQESKQQTVILPHQTQKQKQQQKPEQQEERNVDGVTIFCRICEDFIAHSVATACEHTFCELCLVQYMLYIDDCPECGARIRHQRLSNNILLDNLIKDYIKKYEPQEVEIYEERIQKFKTYQKDKKLNDFETGTKVDVRDSDYVWCTGRIHRTINKVQDKKVKWMIVKYDKTNKKQEFPQNSPRIAPLGFYTGRKDIPKYHRGKLILENQEENVTYSIPNHYDEEEEKEQNQENS